MNRELPSLYRRSLSLPSRNNVYTRLLWFGGSRIATFENLALSEVSGIVTEIVLSTILLKYLMFSNFDIFSNFFFIKIHVGIKT